MWRFIHDPSEAQSLGAAARGAALSRYGLGRFLADWDARLSAWAPAAAAGGGEIDGREAEWARSSGVAPG